MWLVTSGGLVAPVEEDAREKAPAGLADGEAAPLRIAEARPSRR